MNKKGKFGIYGGQYVPETVMNAFASLKRLMNFIKTIGIFRRSLRLFIRTTPEDRQCCIMQIK